MGGVIVLLHEPCAPTLSSNNPTALRQKRALEHMHALSNAEIMARMTFLVQAHAIALALAIHNVEFGNPPLGNAILHVDYHGMLHPGSLPFLSLPHPTNMH